MINNLLNKIRLSSQTSVLISHSCDTHEFKKKFSTKQNYIINHKDGRGGWYPLHTATLFTLKQLWISIAAKYILIFTSALILFSVCRLIKPIEEI